jgi:hypothetical protein
LTNHCPECGEALEVEEQARATRVHCRTCGQEFACPGPPLAAAELYLPPTSAARRARSSIDDYDEECDEWSPDATPDNSTAALASLVLGNLALFAWILPLPGGLLSVLGLALGRIGKYSPHQDMASVGTLLNAFGLVLAVLHACLRAYWP